MSKTALYGSALSLYTGRARSYLIKAGIDYSEAVPDTPDFANAASAIIPSDRKIDGVDLMPYIACAQQNAPHDTLLWRHGTHQTGWHKGCELITSDDSKNGADAPQLKWLFNLEVDPTEQTNLAGYDVEKVAEQAETAWLSTTNSAQRIDKHGGEPFEDTDEYIYFPN